MKFRNKKISEHISYLEATKSRTAIKYHIDNTPSKEELERMKYVAENIFEKVRNNFLVPIGISSFYRNKKLNKKLGGSTTSEHVYGSAIDIDADMYGMITNADIFHYIKDNLCFNQLIWEYGNNKEPNWVHVSSKKTGNKGEILIAYKKKNWRGKYITKYKKYI